MAYDNTLYLFVYGTLMRGFDNPFAIRLRTSSKYLGTASMEGTLYRVSWYPGALFQPGKNQRVWGEVYELTSPASTLKELDAYEEVSAENPESMYIRRTVPVLLGDGLILECWTYLYNRPVAASRRIASGRFTRT